MPAILASRLSASLSIRVIFLSILEYSPVLHCSFGVLKSVAELSDWARLQCAGASRTVWRETKLKPKKVSFHTNWRPGRHSGTSERLRGSFVATLSADLGLPTKKDRETNCGGWLTARRPQAEGLCHDGGCLSRRHTSSSLRMSTLALKVGIWTGSSHTDSHGSRHLM